MTHKFTTLLRNCTWLHVPHQLHMHVLGCKWVYRLKTKPNGTIDHYKVHLVAQGIDQQVRFDYFEKLIPVIKIIMVRVLLTLTISRN